MIAREEEEWIGGRKKIKTRMKAIDTIAKEEPFKKVKETKNG